MSKFETVFPTANLADRTTKSLEARLVALYTRNAADLKRLAYALTGSQEVAEELVNEAFVRVLGRFRGSRPPEWIESYLRKTVINLAKSHGRKARREQLYLRRHRAVRVPAEAQPRRDVVIWDALLELSVRQRAAVYLRYYEDLSEAEAAVVLGCSAGAVKSLVFRALRKLRENAEVVSHD